MEEQEMINMDTSKSLNPIRQDTSDDFLSLMEQGFSALMPTIRAANSLPKGQFWDLFCASPLFKPMMDSLGNKALELMTQILHHQGLHHDIRKRDLEEKHELIVQANDQILERVALYLDELSGIRRNPTQAVPDTVAAPANTFSGSWNRDVTNSAVWKEVNISKESQTPLVLRNARITQRPQVQFLDKIDNSSTPFEPRIKEKPNALKPLAILYEDLPNEDACYSHPYEFELDIFQGKIDKQTLKPREEKKAKHVNDTPLIMVTEEDQLQDMLQELCIEKEIAVDLEHHSYRSFQGFTCLMQISTRHKDYIIDALKLRHKLYILNEVFTNSKIVKVFHGADSDVKWLQRDLSLYVVNMFDTYQAAFMLSLPRHSLAFLLKTYCNIDANKHFQLYDWRTRPLAKEAIKYAREDTHYLLYIYDVIWNKLIEKSKGDTHMLQSVIFRSADTCKKRYWKFIFKNDSYDSMYRQSKKCFDNRQMYAMKELYAWRDKTAREEDESTGYILPNHMLLLIAEKLPKEMQGILACCNPIPPLVRQNLVLLHQLILRAREQPLVARAIPGLSRESRSQPAPQANVNLEGTLHCPHDLTHNGDFRNDFPTLLSNHQIDFSSNVDLIENKPSLSVFEDGIEAANLYKVHLPNQVHFLSPFERYKKMLLYIENEENKSKEEKEREIAEDTQKLLDECMRERQRSTSANNSNLDNVSPDILIKEEDQDYSHNSKKRDRSQDSNNPDNSEENYYIEIKEEPKYGGHKHKRKDETFSNDTNFQEVFDSKTNSNSSVKDELPPNKKKKTGSDSKKAISVDVGAKKKTVIRNTNCDSPFSKTKSSESFAQFDYSQVDYNQYRQAQLPTSRKNPQDTFKHKGKKKQQNRTFTFMRQFQSGSSKKKS